MTEPAPITVLPEKIRENLRRYPNTRPGVTCLECGYVGLMGITRTGAQWYTTWIGAALCCGVMALLLGVYVGIATGAALGFVGAARARVFCFCPNCEREIGPIR